MNIAIIGAGYTGLSAGYYLTKKGHRVTIFEKDAYAGGLAQGMKNSAETFPAEWDWDLEKFYHHWFTNDLYVKKLAKEIGTAHKFITKRPISSILYDDDIFPFDSPLSLLTFPHIPLSDRIKTAVLIAKLKYLTSKEKSVAFENITAHDYLSQHSGDHAYQKIWEPLLKGKFKQHAQNVSMRWFWARIYKRTPKLVYYEGGFSEFAKDITNAFIAQGGQVLYGQSVEQIIQTENGVELIFANQENKTFDKIIATTPPHVFSKQASNLPDEYQEKLLTNKGLSAYTLVLSLTHPLMQNTYWLSVNDESWPFLAVVEHTNFVDKKNYGNEHIVYIGDYVDQNDPILSKSKDEIVDAFIPFLKKINPLVSRESVTRSFLFSVQYAQPIFTCGYQQTIPSIQTPLSNILYANMSQVYPWDRGTNYAIELGITCANSI